MVKKLGIVFLMVILGAVSLVAYGVGEAETVADGLNNPRGYAFAEDGTLFVADTGVGGDVEVLGERGPVKLGNSGAVVAINPDGEKTVIIPNLPSADLGFGELSGPQTLLLTDETLWVGIGESVATASPFSATVIGLDRETYGVQYIIPLYAEEVTNNWDDSEPLNANPVDLELSPDGVLHIVDSGCNCIYAWTAEDGLSPVVVWDDNPVPTSMSFADDGSFYVGFLTGFPFPAGGARVEHYSADGDLVETFEGLTTVVDVMVGDDGTVYAVEFVSNFGERGWQPDSGRVVMIGDDGITPVMENLNFPYHLNYDADGNMVVSINAAFSAPDAGQIIMVNGE